VPRIALGLACEARRRSCHERTQLRSWALRPSRGAQATA
jgi:hypothetical protein